MKLLQHFTSKLNTTHVDIQYNCVCCVSRDGKASLHKYFIIPISKQTIPNLTKKPDEHYYIGMHLLNISRNKTISNGIAIVRNRSSLFALLHICGVQTHARVIGFRARIFYPSTSISNIDRTISFTITLAWLCCVRWCKCVCACCFSNEQSIQVDCGYECVCVREGERATLNDLGEHIK